MFYIPINIFNHIEIYQTFGLTTFDPLTMEGSPCHNCYETLPYYFTIYLSITPRPFLLRNNLLNGVVEILLK